MKTTPLQEAFYKREEIINRLLYDKRISETGETRQKLIKEALTLTRTIESLEVWKMLEAIRIEIDPDEYETDYNEWLD